MNSYVLYKVLPALKMHIHPPNTRVLEQTIVKATKSNETSKVQEEIDPRHSRTVYGKIQYGDRTRAKSIKKIPKNSENHIKLPKNSKKQVKNHVILYFINAKL